MREIVGGRFALQDEIGSGSGGEVFKAVDLDDSGASQVAIKFIKGHPDDPTTKLFFEKETAALARLNHPNIVRLIDFGWHEERAQNYVALEWAGNNLREQMNPPAWSNWDDFADRFAIPLTEALSYAHLENVEHRDIKPENILVKGSTPKLADFGIAKLRDRVDPFGMTLVDWKTRPYAPPDDTFGYEKTRDVWALAVVFIQAMTPLYVADYPDLPARLNEIDVPPQIRTLLGRCIDHEPSSRPANASVLLQDLADIQRSRRADRVRSEATLWLDMSIAATRKLVDAGNPDRGAAHRAMSSDLLLNFHAEYRFDPEAAKLDRSTIFLSGSRWRYTLKRLESSPAYKVVGAIPLRQAEEVRSRSCPMNQLLGVSFWNPGGSRAERAIEILTASLEDFYDRRDRARAERQQDAADNELFEHYLRLMDAREELAQGERTPFVYDSRTLQRRGAVFTVSGSVDRDLIGEEWDVRVGGTRTVARGEVVAQTDESITLHFRREARSIPDSGELTPYLGPTGRAHDRQVDAVRKIRDGHNARPDLRELLIAPQRIHKPVPQVPPQWFRADLDASKRDAVSAALGAKDFVLVEGPPGTGKTSMITELVLQHLRRSPRTKILIVSQTHVAVDNALDRLDAAGVPGLVRLGQPADPRISTSVKHLLLQERMDSWAKALRSKAERHMSAVAERYGVPIQHLNAAIALEELGAILGNLEHLRSKVITTDSERSKTAATGVDRRRDRVALQENIDALEDRRGDLLNVVRGHLGDDLELPDDLTIADTRATTGALLGNASASRALVNLVKLQGEWLQRVASDRKLAEAFLTTTNVLAGTCIGFLGHPAMRELEFDLCILDEASKATATEALVPISRSRQWVLVGDTRQLPPMDEEVLRKPELMRRHNIDEQFVQDSL
ncbi:MAG: protein kinase [Kineosporiaceae bacterium]|nr:protein kinase [Kineosporiaceae bacterium]